MRQIVELRSKGGGWVSIVLDNWGSGLDYALRRWVLVDGYWQCVDTGDVADEARLSGFRIFSVPAPLPGLR
jgi:hypothetical protein